MRYCKNTTQRKSHSTKLLKQHIKTQLRKSNIAKSSFWKKTPRVSVFSNTTGASKIQIHNLGLHQKDRNTHIFGWCSELQGHIWKHNQYVTYRIKIPKRNGTVSFFYYYRYICYFQTILRIFWRTDTWSPTPPYTRLLSSTYFCVPVISSPIGTYMCVCPRGWACQWWNLKTRLHFYISIHSVFEG